MFGYELEDIDQTESGADVYNGQKSVLWVNLRNAYYDEIASMYQTLRSTGALSYAKVEKMFEDHQSKWPETLFNEDSYFKYIKPFIEDGEDYLDMLQGSKAEQRKWWLYNRFRYIDSKYNAGDALTDVITVRGYAKDNITITPYADIYPTVKYGSYLVHERGKRNTPTTVVCPLDQVNDTEIYIYSASQLASVGDLSGLKPGLINVASATRLQNLKVGDSDPNYSNANLISLSMGNNVLLRTVDVRNCPNLTSAIDMTGCTNVEEVYFDGTNITSVDLPNGGVLRVLHLPASVTSLTILNQGNIEEFVLPSYENLTSIRLENVSSVIDPITILHSINAGSRVRIIGFYIEVESLAEIEDFLAYLKTMRGLDERGQNVDTAQVQGIIHIPFITGEILGQFKKDYPNITITYDHIESKIYYYNFDGSELLYTETVNDEGNGLWDGSPSRDATAQYYFAFGGWSLDKDSDPDEEAVKKISFERTVYAAYIKTLRSYTVTWVNTDDTELEVDENVPYGTTPTYDGNTPEYGGRYSDGWDPEVGPVTGDITYKATYLPWYTVWFYNGSTLLATKQVKEGTDVTYEGEDPVDPEGTGAEWIGWATTYGTHTADPNALKNIRRNTYIYAVFAADYEFPTSYDVSDAYGIEWNYGSGTMKVTRTGLAAAFGKPSPATNLEEYGTSPFDSIMPWAGMKRYNIINGSVAYSEDDAGFDQNAYDTFVYIPEFYYTAQKDKINGLWIWAISPIPKNGYVKHPGSGRYIGRYHSTSSTESEGYVVSKSGRLPTVSQSHSWFRIYSGMKGENFQQLDLATWSAVQLLYLIEYADFDAQITLGTGHAGVSTEVAVCGGTDSAVYHTLKASYTDNMYRWIENPFSNCRTWINGFMGNRSLTYAAARNSYTGNVSQLNSLGFGLPSSGNIAGFGYSEAAAWAFIPDTAYVDASAETTIDYVSSAAARCVAFVGGDYNAYDSHGMFFFYASIGSESSFQYVGSRLMFIES